jgi:hypothetical protein
MLLTACNQSNQSTDEIVIEGINYLEGISINMSKKDLIERIGEPDSIVDLGRVTDENQYTQHLETYFYGPNQSVTLINDTVRSLDYNIKQTEARIQHRIDSAKAAQH